MINKKLDTKNEILKEEIAKILDRTHDYRDERFVWDLGDIMDLVDSKLQEVARATEIKTLEKLEQGFKTGGSVRSWRKNIILRLAQLKGEHK